MHVNTVEVRGSHAFGPEHQRDPSEYSFSRSRDRDKRENERFVPERLSRDNSQESYDRRSSRSRGRNCNETERSYNDSDSSMSARDIPLSNGDPNISYMMGNMDGVMMNMFMNPSMMGMSNYVMSSIIPPDPNMIPAATSGEASLVIAPTKEIIHFKSCTLFPPSPHAPAPTTRERPPGCRTVFVGGLPEKMTEEILHEIFERCGEITTLRLSKKNFCHIRFVFEASVESALFLSGYKVRIGSNVDTNHTGRLHVDYAQARDDQYEWECRQRQLQREQRHRERLEEERLKVVSPPPVTHYTDHEASNIAEKIKQDDTFTHAVQVVITWLERGDCTKKNCNTFYSMIQSTNSHVRRLLVEKSHYEEELKKAKELLKGRMQGILLQFSHIERLFGAAHHKKVWDHFTKAQRKNIEAWKKQSLEIKSFQLEDVQDKNRDDDEMEVSDDDEPARKKMREVSAEESYQLKEENDSLKCQVEAYKNEVEVLKMDHKKDLEDKDKQIKLLQQTLQGMQLHLMAAKKRQTRSERKVRDLEAKLGIERSEEEVITLDDDEESEDANKSDDSDNVSNKTETTSGKTDSALTRSESAKSGINQASLSNLEAKLVGVISAFLNVHPFGAGLDYIWSYVSKIESNVRTSEIESLMSRFPNVFRQELIGIGANIERKWMFTAFTNKPINSNSGSDEKN